MLLTRDALCSAAEQHTAPAATVGMGVVVRRMRVYRVGRSVWFR